jgi:hypothetical protein
MKLLLTITLALFMLAFCSFAQAPATTPDAPPADLSIVLAFGGGASQFSEPHMGMTGSIGFRIADGTYFLTSLDMGTKLDPATNTRQSISTIRTGIQRRIAGQGPLNLFAALDAGAAVGGGNVVGALSGGGSITYDLPKHPNLFVYGSVRVVKSPSDPTSSVVQTAFSAGIGLKLK